ncbi:MAG: type 2 periplasmic-binding domain-containing protein, partial [Candidatus Helarchaeales archaeon]
KTQSNIMDGNLVEQIKRRPKSHLFSYFILFMICFTTGLMMGIQIGGNVQADYHLMMAYSSEKDGWIAGIISEFKQWFYEETGKTISVNFRPMGSRSIILSVLTGEIKPAIISPASSIWLPYLNGRWQSIYGRDAVDLSDPTQVVECVYSPIVIGTWKSYNESVGGIFGFQDIYELSKGALRWAHTDPQLSNSGFMTVIMMVASYLSKNTSDLVSTDLQNINLQAWMKQAESKIAFYGKSTGFLAKKSVELGLNLFMVYENLIVDINQKNLGGTDKAIAIYPNDGTLYSDHPFAILDADWVTPNEKFAAEKFLEFIQREEIVMQAVPDGFRPINSSILTNPTYKATFDQYFSEDNGVQENITVPIYGTNINSVVLEQITDLWIVTRNIGL